MAESVARLVARLGLAPEATLRDGRDRAGRLIGRPDLAALMGGKRPSCSSWARGWSFSGVWSRTMRPGSSCTRSCLGKLPLTGDFKALAWRNG
jgi:hypothetical protein